MTDYTTSTFLLCPSDTCSIHLYTALAILQPRMHSLLGRYVHLLLAHIGKGPPNIAHSVRPLWKTVQTDYTDMVSFVSEAVMESML